MLELCNYDGKLEVKSLALGHPTKRHNDNSAGTHGEGSKVAALVMIRNGHQAKFVANGFSRNIGFEKDEKVLSCNLSKVNGKNLHSKNPTTLDIKNHPSLGLQEALNELLTQNRSHQEASSPQATIAELENNIRQAEIDIGQLQHRNDQLTEQIRGAIRAKDRARKQRNGVLAQKLDMDDERDEALETAQRLGRERQGSFFNKCECECKCKCEYEPGYEFGTWSRGEEG